MENDLGSMLFDFAVEGQRLDRVMAGGEDTSSTGYLP